MLIFLFLYFGIIIGLRSYFLLRKTNVNAIDKFGSKSKHSQAENLIRIALFLLLVIGLNFCFMGTNYKYFLPIHFLEISWLNFTGFIISIVGLTLTFIAQLQMGNSWRLGIDDEKKESLISHGLFSISRNPIYIGLGISFIGFFLIAPNLGSVVFLILMTIAIRKKVRDEENFLTEFLPEVYKAYCAKVRRWL